ncbi:MAG TPA: hypothetical protein V6D08_05720 [Candidatus Obscuribacterales bacterium]
MAQVMRPRLAAAALSLALLGAPLPCPAQVGSPLADFDSTMLKLFGRDVWFGPSPDNPGGTRRYLYSPFLGAYTLGPDKNFEGLNPLEALLRQSVILPKADPTYLGQPIPATSGAILPIDINRALVDEGMHEAAPDAFRHPAIPEPWYSKPDEQMCAAAFENAWTFSSSAIAPEVEAFKVRLPGQKIGTENLIVGGAKPDFATVVTSGFGAVCIKDGARALVCRSSDCLRVANLTGKKHSVLVRFPSGKALSVGPGGELVATRSPDLLQSHPADGIARRATGPVFSTGDLFVRVNELSPATVLLATGLSRGIGSAGNAAEKRLCATVMKSAAVLAVMRGSHGFRSATPDGGSALAHKAGTQPIPNGNRLAKAGESKN